MRLYDLEYLPSARRDMVEIIRYIARNLNNEGAALRLAEKFDEAVKILLNFPYSCPVYYPLRTLRYEYRKLIVGKYIMFYRVTEETKTVTVACVVYSGSDYEKQLS